MRQGIGVAGIGAMLVLAGCSGEVGPEVVTRTVTAAEAATVTEPTASATATADDVVKPPPGYLAEREGGSHPTAQDFVSVKDAMLIEEAWRSADPAVRVEACELGHVGAAAAAQALRENIDDLRADLDALTAWVEDELCA